MEVIEKYQRVIIEGVKPEIDAGRFPAKRVVGELVRVEADLFTEGHDKISGFLLYRPRSESEWRRAPLEPLVNDRWTASFRVDRLEPWVYTIAGWIDRFRTKLQDLKKKFEAGQDVDVEILEIARILEDIHARADAADRARFREVLDSLNATREPVGTRLQPLLDPDLPAVVAEYPDPPSYIEYPRELVVQVDRPLADFSAWYEMFPRSLWNGDEKRHATLADCRNRLPYIAGMGFDILYLPPIHPIGRAFRKGRNNTLNAGPADVGSPWAIGGKEGGHKAVHPDLGTLEDFRALVSAAKDHGLEIALDIAFQCSPDHPWVREHPEWFQHRPDGTIKYAENPPKKYQDIYPIDFESEDRVALWNELKSVFEFWMEQGVRIFRVDNPHTKPFAFWEWCLAELKNKDPGLIFLSEAFTRPKVMKRLAKIGYTQSYTYFAWRNTRRELEEYLTELTQTEVVEYFRPSFWPNTPDILTEFFHEGSRPAFMLRFALAATLTASYGIYGPAYELQEHLPREPGSEEYLHSEKYEVRRWDVERPDSLRDFITRLNRIRKENPALRTNRTLRFHRIDNPELIAYSKIDESGANIILVIVNLNPHHRHQGWVELPLEDWKIEPDEPYQLHDLLDDARYFWSGAWNFVELDPKYAPAHVFSVRRKSRSERDFDYFS